MHWQLILLNVKIVEQKVQFQEYSLFYSGKSVVKNQACNMSFCASTAYNTAQNWYEARH